MKKITGAIIIAVFCFLWVGTARADLLGVNPGVPQINFVNVATSAVAFDPDTAILSINATPFSIIFSSQDSGSIIVSNRTIQIQLDTDGSLISGTNGFIVDGQFTHVDSNGVTNAYSGLLLQGDVIAFGYLPASGSVAEFDFRVHLTGGQLESFFDCADDLAITMSSEDSDFTGSFTNQFSGGAKGSCGPEDLTPPTVTCPPLSAVVTTPATDPNNPANSGFIITYPNPVVTDNCDPAPTIFCDTPSGSFVALNPGDSLTVTCYGIDGAGNVGTCSFTAVMGASNTCPLAFAVSNLPPVTLPADSGMCSATYDFALPIATNCSGQSFVATATAITETGTTISLTTLTNGLVQGIFPHTFTTNGNIITFTANDGQGNQVVLQVQVFVKDTQPPNIMCLNQTATFKPILTNALSCIEADFNNVCINAGDTLWFDSAIQNTSFRNNGQFTVHIFDQTILLQVDNTNITLDVPDAYVYYSNGVSVATTVFTNNQWVTLVNAGNSGRVFASGLSWQLPFNLNNAYGGIWGRDMDNGHLRRLVKSVTWCGRFAIDTPGVVLQWQWGAVVEHGLTNGTDCNALGVKCVDDNRNSCWKNLDPAGSCENFKVCLVKGACGNGWFWNGNVESCDCTGIQSGITRVNLGKGIVCEGVVDFNTPLATDNCDGSVKVTCNPPSGSVFGPGNYTINCTAVDSSGNSNQCSFTLTVLPPLQVVFDSPACDNIDDNTAEPDAGFTDMNCPDDPSTPAFVNCFHPGDKICHVVRLLDCNGNDVTTSLCSNVTVHIDVCERQGTYSNSVLISDVPNSSQMGDLGSIMIPNGGSFQYYLDTTGYQSGTMNNSKFFRACVWVEYNSSPGLPVGMEDVILESY